MAIVIFFTCFVLVSVGMVGADEHHIVRGQTGWESSYHPSVKPSETIFKVGDHIWFHNASTQDSIVEVRSRKEYISCDVSNPIRMYTDGPDTILLQEEGIRYFASGNPRECKNGLKLHVAVKNHDETQTVGSTKTTNSSAMIKATGPTPSTSAHLSGLSCLVFIGLLVVLVGLI